ncbi:MAG: 3-oxoacyl-ACP synthase III [Proteobacteria bacterium]|nr:3-oxoacyl-ACP synthase III [Desulfobulbaceae bacterium]MBU4154221.1 3-oxoacyl-ACP synthase III [Pseudomonadota bacterium]MDP2106942.1 3-oxoacyl-ACP synthase III [Desulfobulbaceae bacterium]
MHFSNVAISSLTYQLPPHQVSSAELEERLGPVYTRLKLPHGRLALMSGIDSRRFWDPGTRPSHGAAKAGAKALAASGLAPSDIDCLINTSVCRDMIEPATASFVHHALGLNGQCLIFDLSNACLGFLNGMMVLASMIELGQIRHGLLVAGETAEDLVETTIASLLADETLTRKGIKGSFASLTIGSGAVACVLSRTQGEGHRLVGGACRANTGHSNLCQGDGGSSGTLMKTDSEELLKRGVETAAQVWPEFMEELGWSPESIACYCCHQVGSAHARLLMETLGLDPANNFETLASLGNVGSVSAPITMAMAVEAGKILPGDRAALLGIGSGINCLMLGVEW